MKLYFLPEKEKSFFTCLAAVKNDFSEFIYVPNSLKNNKEFLTLAIRSNANLFVFIPEEYKNEEFYLSIIDNDKVFKLLDDSEKTTNLCFKAIEHNFHSFYYIPDKFLTFELYVHLLKCHPRANDIGFIKNQYRKLFLERLCSQ